MVEKMQQQISGIPFTDEEVIRFERGMPGFRDLHKFLITSEPEQAPFHWLHSIEQPGLRFVLINPLLIRPEYSPRISKLQLEELHLASAEDLLMYVIVTLDRLDMQQSTVNLCGPVLVNIKEHLACQIILDDRQLDVRAPIFGGGA